MRHHSAPAPSPPCFFRHHRSPLVTAAPKSSSSQKRRPRRTQRHLLCHCLHAYRRYMNQIIPHAAHWGAFDTVVRDGRIVDVRPFARDPAPSPIIYGAADAVHAANRIDRPYVRKGWLNGDRAGGTLRGNEPFVPLDWDKAVTLVAHELARV